MSRIFRSLPAALLALPAALVPATAAGAAGTEAGCAVGFAWRQQTRTAHLAVLTITNTGAADIRGWTLRFTLPAAQQIVQAKGAILETTSGAIVAHDIVTNAVVAPGASVAVTYQATGTGAAITAFTVNEVACG